MSEWFIDVACPTCDAPVGVQCYGRRERSHRPRYQKSKGIGPYAAKGPLAEVVIIPQTEDFLSVQCPRCQAEPGKHCKTRDGFARIPHERRTNLWYTENGQLPTSVRNPGARRKEVAASGYRYTPRGERFRCRCCNQFKNELFKKVSLYVCLGCLIQGSPKAKKLLGQGYGMLTPAQIEVLTNLLTRDAPCGTVSDYNVREGVGGTESLP